MRKVIKTTLLFLASIIKRDHFPKVVFYHDIGMKYTPMGTEADLFWAHMTVMKGSAHVICFDDGFRGLWDHRETLKMCGVTPIVFLAVRLVGGPGCLTWDEIRTLESDYGFVFQSHTWSHQTLAGPMIDESPIEERTESWFHRELVESRREIARQLGHEIDELCFPVGHFSASVVERCRAAGYKKVYASYPGILSDGYVQPRCLVQFLSARELKLVLKGGMNLLSGYYHRRHFFS